MTSRIPAKGSQAFFQGFADGVEAFRLTLPHAVPSDHPHGSTPAGRDWFLGCCAALESCTATILQKEAPNEQQLAGGI